MCRDPLIEIAKKLDQGKLILFVGSGMSSPYFPTWRGLLEELHERVFGDDSVGAAEVKKMIEDKEFLNAAWAIQQKSGDAWRKYVGTRFRNNQKDRSEKKHAIHHHQLRRFVGESAWELHHA